MPGRRFALLVATELYDDANFRGLAAPSSDAEELADVLGDDMLGAFETTVLRNASSRAICEALETLLTDRLPEDVVLLHFACHGVKHRDSGELHLVAKNTKHERYVSTAISATTIHTLISQSRAGTILLLLDCCFGGAYPEGRRAVSASEVDVEGDFGLNGEERGRVVITASSATEFAFEGADLVDNTTGSTSVFTRALIEGLRSGAADLDGDGRVGIDELYDYLYTRVRSIRPDQSPRKSASDVKGAIFVSLSPRRRVESTDLPADLFMALRGNDINARLGATYRLTELAASDDLALAATARAELERLADDDSRTVCDVAARGLRETSLTLSSTELDLGEIYAGGATAPAVVRLLGVPVVQLSSASSAPGLRISIDADRLMVRPDRLAPGPFTVAVTVSGPAGTAELTVTGTVVIAPSTLSHEAETICGQLKAPHDRAFGYSFVAATVAIAGRRDHAMHLLAQADIARARLADSRSFALLTAIRAGIKLLIDDPAPRAGFLIHLAEAIRICVYSSSIRIAALLLIGRTALFVGSPAEAMRVLDEARRSALSTGTTSLARRLTTIFVEWLRIRFDNEQSATEFFERAMVAVRRQKSQPAEAVALLLALAWLAELTADSHQNDLPPLGAALRRLTGVQGSRAKASSLAEEAGTLLQAIDLSARSAWLCLLQGWVLFQIGQRDEAWKSIVAAEEAAAGVQPDVVFLDAHTAATSWIRARLGDQSQAAQFFSKAATAVRSKSADAIEQSAMLAVVAWAAGCTTNTPGEGSGPVNNFLSWAIGVRSSPRDVVELLTSARQGIPRDCDTTERAWLLVLFGWVESQVSHVRKAASSLSEAERIAADTNNPAFQRAHRGLTSWVHARMGNQTRATQVIDDMLAAISVGSLDPRTKVLLLVLLAWITNLTIRPASARFRSLTLTEQPVLPLPGWLSGAGRLARWVIGVRGRSGQVAEILAEASAVATALPDGSDRAWLLVTIGWAADIVEERDAARSALTLAERTKISAAGGLAGRDVVKVAAGWVWARMGDQPRLDRFFPDAARAVRSTITDPAKAGTLLFLLAWLTDFTGRSPVLTQRPSTESARPGDTVTQWLSLAARFLRWLVAARGDRVQVESVLNEARAAARSIVNEADRVPVLVLAGLVECDLSGSRTVMTTVEELRRIAHGALSRTVTSVAALAGGAVIQQLQMRRNGRSAHFIQARLRALLGREP